MKTWVWIPVLTFFIFWIHGWNFGLSDDEAYYWVLAQEPRLAFAFHPPAVVWSIGLSQFLFGGLVQSEWMSISGMVRWVSAAYTAGIVFLCLYWISLQGVSPKKVALSSLILMSFVGFFGLSWMVVPDLPLFFGWLLAFVSTWMFCFGRPRLLHSGMLVLGISLSMLSKYSGILVPASVFAAFLVYVKKANSSLFKKGFFLITLGVFIGLLPPFLWNLQNGWESLLYQVRDRHEGSGISGIRYLRFWLIELALAGPGLLIYSFLSLKRWKKDPMSCFVLLWAAPAALVYLVQPLFSDFKPHWALIVWFPFALELAVAFGKSTSIKLAKWQMAYGLPLLGFLIIACHQPVLGALMGHAVEEKPTLDVTNDLYGWDELPDFIEAQLGKEGLLLPVIGSRYQTASQAAYGLKNPRQVARIPRSEKEKDEWPDLGVTEGYGPAWPKLLRPVLFVADNRYHQGPAFKNAECTSLGKKEVRRGNYLAKVLEVWRCVPNNLKLPHLSE